MITQCKDCFYCKYHMVNNAAGVPKGMGVTCTCPEHWRDMGFRIRARKRACEYFEIRDKPRTLQNLYKDRLRLARAAVKGGK